MGLFIQDAEQNIVQVFIFLIFYESPENSVPDCIIYTDYT